MDFGLTEKNFEAYQETDINFIHYVDNVEDYMWVPIVGGITCAYMAWGIGANDAANSWGTSFGSNSVTLPIAVVLASIFEAAGAFALGTNVSSTVKRKIIPFTSFCADDYSRVLRMLGMWAVLISAGTCLMLSSCYGVPVSTTHAAVGGTAGFGIVTRGWTSVDWWPSLGKVFIAWVTGPLVGAVGGFIIMFLFNRFIMYAPKGQVWKRTQMAVPFLASLCIAITVLFAFKVGGKRSYAKDMDWYWFLLVFFGSFIAALIPTFLFYKWYIPYLGFSKNMTFDEFSGDSSVADTNGKGDEEMPAVEDAYAAAFQPEYQPGSQYLPSTPAYGATPYSGPYTAPVPNADKEDEVYDPKAEAAAAPGEVDPMDDLTAEQRTAEQLFKPLAVMIACGESFAHGANDVGNAIGPYAALMSAYDNDCPDGKGDIPYWVLTIGAAGIVVGLMTLGWKVMDTIGKKVTKVTPSRAYITEMSATISIMIATEMAIPVSTSHTSVGALTGMALAQGGIKNVNWKVIGMVCLGIVLTVPGTALYAGALTAFLHAIVFGASYPPNYVFCQDNSGLCPIIYVSNDTTGATFVVNSTTPPIPADTFAGYPNRTMGLF